MGAVVGVTDIGGWHYVSVFVPGNETAGTESVSGHWVAPAACKVYEVTAVSGAAITGADTNTRHLNVIGPAGSERGARDFALGTDAAANTSYSLYSSATGFALTAGQMLIGENELIGTGQAAPAGFTLRVKFAWT